MQLVRDRNQAVLATLSENATGITARVADFLFERNANILGLYSTQLGCLYGEYAYFEAPPEDVVRIEAECDQTLAELRPRVVRTSAAPPSRGGDLYDLSIYSFDRVGIVAQTTDLIRNEGVDILSMASCAYSAPMIGSPLFVVQMKLDLPTRVPLPEFCSELNSLADEHGWDLRLKPVAQSPIEDERVQAIPYPPSRAQHDLSFALLKGSAQQEAPGANRIQRYCQ